MKNPALDTVVERQMVKPPAMWNVVLHNDDFTPIDLVVALLIKVFNKNQEDAHRITLSVHQQGKGIVGQYNREIAEVKQAIAIAAARKYESPLLITVEQA